MSYQDKIQTFIDNTIQAIESSSAPWQVPWKEGELFELPRSFVTGKDYRGVNLVELARKGYNDPRWMTYNQAREHGLHVRKGEKSTPALYYSPTRLIKEQDENGNTLVDKSTGKPRTKEVDAPVFKTFALFNGTQIEGLNPYLTQTPEWKPDWIADDIINSFKRDISITESQQERAFYSPAKHAIEIPAKASFKSQSEYYSTIFHELAHATKHPDLLDRQTGPASDKQEYAKEELRAEIATWLICTQIGVGYTPESEKNNEAYVAGWLKKLPKNQRQKELLAAIRDGEKISEFVLSQDKEVMLWKEKLSESPTQEKVTDQIVPDKDSGSAEKILLSVPFEEKDRAKELGARWDRRQKSWFIEPDQDPEPYRKWLQTATQVESAAQKVKLDESSWNIGYQDGLAGTREHEREVVDDLSYSSGWIEGDGTRELSVQRNHDETLAAPDPERTYLDVSFEEKDQAKELGAKWDRRQKAWFIEPDQDPEPFRKWLQSEKTTSSILDFAEIEKQFRDQAAGLGLKVDTLVMDGSMQRVPVDTDKAGKKSGAYVIYPDGRPAGFMQNHKTGEKINVKYEGELPRDAVKQKGETSREEELQARYEKAAKTAFGIYVNAAPAPKDHPYLLAKKIEPEDGIRVDNSNRLIIPLKNPKTDRIESLQFISENGDKYLLKDGRKSGNCCVLGKLEADKPILLAEGYATGKSLQDIAHLPAVVCFDAGNMENVAHSIKELMPDAEIFICADNDHSKKKNVGLEKARRVAKAIGGEVIVPEFSEQQKKQGLTDFNDLANSRFGRARVKKALERKIPFLAKAKEQDHGLGLEMGR
ncbi:DUF5710 domain-containing protein [Desulforhopalus singaporensis]|uniref:Antirestriction protein ArdC n=1 Tax=Desulforhopalus singaporensis TaxID=91360 RepID=A0A1H0S2H3_9BACT|nr:DUF5710 domain-containing protein [Desulforhopalus singaporensis]SDP35837.1 Antirestriction protein ArdC [Desulforhopalus singaporensis]